MGKGSGGGRDGLCRSDPDQMGRVWMEIVGSG
jgi:hypothetical protein